MELNLNWIIAGLILCVVAFFAYQWFTIASTKKVKTRSQPVPRPMAQGPGPSQDHGEASPDPPQKSEQYPTVAGQTEADLRQKEPPQRQNPPTNQQPVSSDGKAPADFKENLRRPEQSFHEASGPPPTLKVSDLPAGRAVDSAGPGFNPELAQNDGPMVGNVFAFDGMEPTGFANF